MKGELIEIDDSSDEEAPTQVAFDDKDTSADDQAVDQAVEIEGLKSNPFAMFACSSMAQTDKHDFGRVKKRSGNQNTQKSNNKNKKAKTTSHPRICSLSKEEEIVRNKWFRFVEPEDPLEDRRFQLLVAARLHARCQDKAVYSAMKALREKLAPNRFSVETLARSDPLHLQESIANLQFYSVKARHIVEAAKQIIQKYDGKVPETENHLRSLMGIGPVMADLLTAINARRVHLKRDECVLCDQERTRLGDD